jgi:hypothetical protein
MHSIGRIVCNACVYDGLYPSVTANEVGDSFCCCYCESAAGEKLSELKIESFFLLLFLFRTIRDTPLCVYDALLAALDAWCAWPPMNPLLQNVVVLLPPDHEER